MTDTVVVVGANSYIGSSLVRRLLDGGHRVVGTSRRPAVAQMLLPEPSDSFAIATPGEALSLIEGEPVSIVNLAFIKGALPHWIHRQNRRLVSSIAQMAARGHCRRLVHVSTVAVFGIRLTEPPTPVRVRRPPPDLYAEQKLHAEHMIERLGRKLGGEFGIVRLGNVIGPGSPIWVGAVGQRVMEVKPVGYEGEPGISNTTHVENVADYIAYLIGQPPGALPQFGPYHHLAEFSSHRWSELLDVMSEAIGHAWTTVARQETSARRRTPSVKQILKAPYAATPADRHIRVGLGLLPEWEIFDRLIARVREPPPPEMETGGDRVGLEAVGLLDVLSSEHEFASWTLDGWNPKLDFASACSGIADWLRASAYDLRRPVAEADDLGARKAGGGKAARTSAPSASS